jgi:hypothetical protein
LRPEQPHELQGGHELPVFKANEDRISAEPVPEMVLLSFEFPLFEEGIGHGVVMDRQDQFALESLTAVARLNRLGFALPSVTSSVSATPSDFNFLDPLRQPQTEIKLPDIVGALRAGRFGRMSDIQDDPEFGSLAARAGFPGRTSCLRNLCSFPRPHRAAEVNPLQR